MLPRNSPETVPDVSLAIARGRPWGSSTPELFPAACWRIWEAESQ